MVMAETVVFHSIAVNALEDNSGIFVGDNVADGWASHSKTQGGINSIIGFYNRVSRNLNIVQDQDLLDTQINDIDYRGSTNTTQV
jgi:hypothetical protein